MQWYVVFMDVPDKYWWRPLLKKGFRHCMCYRKVPNGVFIINFTGGGVDAYFLECESAEWMAKAYKNSGDTVLVGSEMQKSSRISFGGFIYCVNLVKSVLGLRGCLALTPHGLYKKLKKLNFMEI